MFKKKYYHLRFFLFLEFNYRVTYEICVLMFIQLQNSYNCNFSFENIYYLFEGMINHYF